MGLQSLSLPKGLKRFHSAGDEDFITCSWYHRHPFLASARREAKLTCIIIRSSATWWNHRNHGAGAASAATVLTNLDR